MTWAVSTSMIDAQLIWATAQRAPFNALVDQLGALFRWRHQARSRHSVVVGIPRLNQKFQHVTALLF